MSDLNIDHDPDNKMLKLDNGRPDTGITLKQDESTMLGVELLANPTKSKVDLNVTDNISGGYSSGEESYKSEKNLTVNEDYDFFNKINDNENDNVNETVREIKDPEIKKISTPFIEDDPMINNIKGAESSEYRPIHTMNSQDIKNEKIDLIYKFKKLESQGIRTTMNYNMNSHLEDMRNEYIKLKKQREVDNSVKFQRKMLMACVTGVEFLNGRFDPFQVKLDGWGESVNENLNDYDEIFEELNEKYGGSGDMAPELRLMFTLAGSAFMFHLSNTMFKSSIPGMDDVLQQNPELMKQFAEAAVGSMNRANGGPGPRQGQGPGQGQPPNPLSAMMGMAGSGGGAPPGANPLQGLMGGLMGGIMGGDRPQQRPSGQQRRQSHSPARSDMSAPDGIDELINKMNLQPDNVQDLDAISLMSGGSDRKSSDRGITLNL